MQSLLARAELATACCEGRRPSRAHFEGGRFLVRRDHDMSLDRWSRAVDSGRPGSGVHLEESGG